MKTRKELIIPDGKIFRTAFDCEYKAWQLVQTKTGDHSSSPIPDNPSKQDKLAIAAWHYSMMQAQGESMEVPEQSKKLAGIINTILQKETAPAFYKISHCKECQFWKTCHQQLIEKDCISLLANMPPKTVADYHRKGIFTILQLSHLFRLRRKRSYPNTASRYLYELKALAIREKKTYVLQVPEMNGGPVAIYLDFEGLPEEDLIYLAGIVIRQTGEADKTFSYWANDKENEEAIFLQLFQLLEQYPEANIFHYGSYETKAFKKWKRIYKEQFAGIEKRMVNLLGYLRTHVYPPTYTNGLKEVAGFLGFSWTEAGTDGLQSIDWRRTEKRRPVRNGKQS